MPDFKTIEVPSGRYIGWGKQGQQVTVKVVSYDPTGGRDFNGSIVPQVTGELTEPCTNYTDLRGDRNEETLPTGELVTIQGSTVNLKKGLLLADPQPGDLLRMTYVDRYKTTAGNDGKVIKVEHAPGAPDPVTADDL